MTDLAEDTPAIRAVWESLGVPGSIQVSPAVRERLRDTFEFTPRGIVDVKGKGPIATWFLVGRTLAAAVRTF